MQGWGFLNIAYCLSIMGDTVVVATTVWRYLISRPIGDDQKLGQEYVLILAEGGN